MVLVLVLVLCWYGIGMVLPFVWYCYRYGIAIGMVLVWYSMENLKPGLKVRCREEWCNIGILYQRRYTTRTDNTTETQRGKILYQRRYTTRTNNTTGKNPLSTLLHNTDQHNRKTTEGNNVKSGVTTSHHLDVLRHVKIVHSKTH